MNKEECLNHLFIFNDHKTNNNNQLIQYILFYNLIEYKCKKCSNDGNWQNEKLSLQLDHIDGKRENNQLDNLQFLCPNCHSQTKTFGARNHRPKPKKEYFCSNNNCEEKIYKDSKSGLCH